VAQLDHPSDTAESREIFIRHARNSKATALGFAAQTGNGHAAIRECTLSRFLEPERRILRDALLE
jgi:hypothetical protein